MSLLFNMLSRLVITFLPRSKRLLISWLQSPSAVILKPKKVKSVTVFIVSPSICHEVMGPDAMILVFWILNFKPALSHSSLIFSSLVAQRIKHLPAVQGTWVQSLGWEDLLEKEMATHSSTLAGRILWTEKPSGLQSTGLQRVGHDWVTSLSFDLHQEAL